MRGTEAHKMTLAIDSNAANDTKITALQSLSSKRYSHVSHKSAFFGSTALQKTSSFGMGT